MNVTLTENNATQPAPLSSKFLGLDNRMFHNQDELSGSLSSKNVLYASTVERIKFTNEGEPSQNYIAKVQSFLPNSPDTNIYKIKKLIVKHEPIAIAYL